MLRIQVNMNSPTGEVLAFKTCCNLRMQDQNLEILVRNEGAESVVVKSFFDLETDRGSRRFHTLLPSPEQHIEPGDIKAFYCQMDDQTWESARRLILHDKAGNRYPVELQARTSPAGKQPARG